MAFDLVYYFTEQLKGQKPQLLQSFAHPLRCEQLQQLNCLSLGLLIQLARQAPDALYKDISDLNPLFIQQLARQLASHELQQIPLERGLREDLLNHIIGLQLSELKQLDQTAHLGVAGMLELLNGQIEHLSGQAPDWVWHCNGLLELVGSQSSTTLAEISLASTLKEFHDMVHLHETQDTQTFAADTAELPTPTWAKIAAPVIALAVLAYLYDWYAVLSAV